MKGEILKFLQKVSESSYCPNSFFYCHTVVGLELKNFNDFYISRKSSSIDFWTVNSSTCDRQEIKSLICRMVNITESVDKDELHEFFMHFYEGQHDCFLALIDNEIIGYYWGFSGEYVLTFDDYHHRNVALNLPEGHIFFGNGYVEPKYRLRGIFPHLAKYSLSHYPASYHFYTATDLDNFNSLNSHIKLGYQKIFHLTCTSLLKLNLFYKSNQNSGPSLNFQFAGKSPLKKAWDVPESASMLALN